MKTGFALICASPLFDDIIKIENEIHSRAGFFNSLGAKENMPHVTLFQGEMDGGLNLGEIAEKIASAARRLIPDKKICFTDVEYVRRGWYFLACEKTRELQKLHDIALGEVKPFIVLDGRRAEAADGLPEIQRSAIINYGYRYAGEAFFPHITIGRAAERREDILCELSRAVQAIERRSAIERVTAYKMGENGVHESTLYEVYL